MAQTGLISDRKTESLTGYRVKIPLFEGPLDLLLFLIQRDQIDIHDIPIAQITEEYLKYLKLMRFLQLDVAAEFLVMAATLMSIKSQMLLPHPEPIDDSVGMDPRQELAQRLLDYRIYKTVAQNLAERENESLLRYQHPEEVASFDQDEEDDLLEVTLFELINAFEHIMEHEPKIITHDVQLEEITVKDRFDYIMAILKNRDKIPFEELIRSDPRTIVMVVTFLALLEMMRAHLVFVKQREAFGKIWVYGKSTSQREHHPFQVRS